MSACMMSMEVSMRVMQSHENMYYALYMFRHIFNNVFSD